MRRLGHTDLRRLIEEITDIFSENIFIYACTTIKLKVIKYMDLCIGLEYSENELGIHVLPLDFGLH